jgi:hypothetical protein
MFGRILPFFLCVALLFCSGCARSYDGTVVIPRPLDVRRFWDQDPSQTRASQLQAQTGVFPVAPPAAPQEPRRLAARKDAPPARHLTRVSNPPSLSAEPTKPLTCKDVSAPGKRYRVVCE